MSKTTAVGGRARLTREQYQTDAIQRQPAYEASSPDDHASSSPTTSPCASDYMTSREAAAYLHLNHRTIVEWARKRILPAIPLGGGSQRKTWLFSRSALDRHLRAMMTSDRPRSIEETTYVD